jgi:histidine triad (HIT) family protein
MQDCIFCKMFAGEVDFRKVYEDRDVLGILDIEPRFAHGQCLVIHRKHVPQFHDLEDEEIAQLFKGVKAVARKIQSVFGSPQVSLFARGISIPTHAHIVVYPSTGEGPIEKVMAGFLALEQLRRTTTAQLDEISDKIRLA